MAVASTTGGSSGRHGRRVRAPSRMGTLVGLIGLAVAVAIARTTGAGWTSSLGAGLLLGLGLYLFAADKQKGWGDLVQGIMVGVGVAIALMAVQRDAEQREDQRQEKEAATRQKAA